ncbi:MAG TPA: hypothetical protein VJS92_05065 [Candidatus Polarisedimenticolaceae bacterium]|nr:hypothetical protein [Candidatus Polarisedimenticolaceae bacterium]
MIRLYFLIFWIPAATSAIALGLTWSQGMLRRPPVFLGWFALALLLQVWAATLSPPWAVGLILQVALAVTLAIKLKLEA